MFERFTERARKVMSLARQNAQRLQQEFIGTEHILLGMLDEGGGVGFKILKNHSVTKDAVEAIVKERLQPTASPTVTLGQLPLSPRCKRVLELAGEFCDKLHHDVIGTEHLLVGLVKENEGIAADILKKLIPNVDVEGYVNEILGVYDQQPKPPDMLSVWQQKADQYRDERDRAVVQFKDAAESLHRTQQRCDSWREKAEAWEAAYWALVRSIQPS